MELEIKVQKLLELLLGKPIDPAKTALGVEPLWDSMKHIEIVMTIEEEFGVLFDPSVIPTLVSYAAIVAKLREIA
ncbi:hypothetical protein FACS189487_08020 [Campylobacterota bacterium]|nr:hypothetical protein FACS189487_08020 [Campylobacterota bacterium]GHV07026.1 hypothetical protein AGMMS50229_12990 [Campylobacterota bacterium]